MQFMDDLWFDLLKPAGFFTLTPQGIKLQLFVDQKPNNARLGFAAMDPQTGKAVAHVIGDQAACDRNIVMDRCCVLFKIFQWKGPSKPK